VDFQFAPFLERMAASLLYFKGFIIRLPNDTSQTQFPAVNKWFDAMETLESYQLTKSDYYTHCWDLPPQLGGCSYEQAGEPYEKAINGERSILDGATRGSWELPLQPHNGGVEPDWDWCHSDNNGAKREAVERLTANHEAIVSFAARGAGRKGMPPVMAPLSDPRAAPNTNMENGVSAVLRLCCMAMLSSSSSSSSNSTNSSSNDADTIDKDIESRMVKTAELIVKEGGQDYGEGIVSSLSYLRDRVGVPRDMRLPAARQLRAHLNWCIAKILDAME